MLNLEPRAGAVGLIGARGRAQVSSDGAQIVVVGEEMGPEEEELESVEQLMRRVDEEFGDLQVRPRPRSHSHTPSPEPTPSSPRPSVPEPPPHAHAPCIAPPSSH